MAKEGQLEKLTNPELQKLYIKDKTRGNKKHLENLRNLHEQARGKHGHTKKNP